MDVTYDNRLEWLLDIAPEIVSNEISEDDTEESDTTQPKQHQQTAKDKISEMIDRLNNQEFTRFWP